jgi:hypothetical protein
MPVRFDVSVPLSTSVSQNVREAYYSRLMDAATAGYNHSLELAPEDRGTLKQTSIAPERRGKDVVWGYTQPYAAPMEYGTQPYYPPLEPLVRWAERVTGNPGLGYYVAREKIPTEGIDAQPYARPGRQRMIDWLKNHGLGDYLEAEQR